jgi:hypothetical protein
MKRILISTSWLICFLIAKAADPAGAPYEVWTYPVVYNLDEKINWYFDLTGTTFSENEDVYLWAWSPSEPDAGNFDNSSDFAKLTYVSEKIWRMEMTPTEYFHMSIDDIKGSAGFWMRLKDKTGTKESDVIEIKLPDISAFVNSGEMYGAIPEKFQLKTPMAILFNSNTLEGNGFADAQSVHVHSGLNNWDVQIQYHAEEWGIDVPQSNEYTQAVDMGNGIFRKDLIPIDYYQVDEDYEMENITFLFVCFAWGCTSPDGILYAADVPIPPAPALTLFPTNFSKSDILRITRTNNIKGQAPLSYEISGAGKTVSGEFSGSMVTQTAFVNILAEFGALNVTTLHIVIKDVNGNVISEFDKPFNLAD